MFPNSSQAAVRAYMGTWDLDGDGSNEMAYNLGQHLEIQSLSGLSFTYKIGASWG